MQKQKSLFQINERGSLQNKIKTRKKLVYYEAATCTVLPCNKLLKIAFARLN
jgi:radical SAM superfamily enzyme